MTAITMPFADWLFVIEALDIRAAEKSAAARAMRDLGVPEGNYALTITDTTAERCETARRQIADALYPFDAMRRQDVADELEMGLS